jgi:hypothetical protein
MTDETVKTTWLLYIEIAGPGLRERVEIEADTPEELKPTYIACGDPGNDQIVFERYLDDNGCWREIRLDWIVMRYLAKHETKINDAEQQDPWLGREEAETR